MPRAFKPCGTRAAYDRHLAHGEVPCDPCTAANARWRQRQRSDQALAPYRRADLAMAVYTDDRRRAAMVAAAFRGDL